jgi:hypothetical protein
MQTAFSVWRSLLPVVEDAPISFCDRRSVSKDGLAACDIIRADLLGEEYFVKFRTAYKWYWMQEQTSAEPVLFLTWQAKFPDNRATGQSPSIIIYLAIFPDAP